MEETYLSHKHICNIASNLFTQQFTLTHVQEEYQWIEEKENEDI